MSTPVGVLSAQEVAQLVKYTQDLERSNAQLQISAGKEMLTAQKEIIELKTRLREVDDLRNKVADLEKNLTETRRQKQEIERLRAAVDQQSQGLQELVAVRNEQMEVLRGEVDRLKEREETLLDDIALLKARLEEEQKAYLNLREEFERKVEEIQRIEKERFHQKMRDHQDYETLLKEVRQIKARYDTEAMKVLTIASVIPAASAAVGGAFGFFVIGPIGVKIRLTTPSKNQRVLKQRIEMLKSPFLELHRRLEKPSLNMDIFNLNKNIPI